MDRIPHVELHIGGLGDILLLHRGVDNDVLLLGGLPMDLNSCRQNPFQARRTNALAEVHHVRGSDRGLPLEHRFPGKELAKGVSHPSIDDCLIAQVEHMLQEVETDHEADGFSRAPEIRIERAQLGFTFCFNRSFRRICTGDAGDRVSPGGRDPGTEVDHFYSIFPASCGSSMKKSTGFFTKIHAFPEGFSIPKMHFAHISIGSNRFFRTTYLYSENGIGKGSQIGDISRQSSELANYLGFPLM
jgi:hypothetical protein